MRGAQTGHAHGEPHRVTPDNPARAGAPSGWQTRKVAMSGSIPTRFVPRLWNRSWTWPQHATEAWRSTTRPRPEVRRA